MQTGHLVTSYYFRAELSLHPGAIQDAAWGYNSAAIPVSSDSAVSRIHLQNAALRQLIQGMLRLLRSCAGLWSCLRPALVAQNKSRVYLSARHTMLQTGATKAPQPGLSRRGWTPWKFPPETNPISAEAASALHKADANLSQLHQDTAVQRSPMRESYFPAMHLRTEVGCQMLPGWLPGHVAMCRNVSLLRESPRSWLLQDIRGWLLLLRLKPFSHKHSERPWSMKTMIQHDKIVLKCIKQTKYR